MELPLPFTPHAAIRRGSRRIPAEAIAAAIQWGRRYRSHQDLVWRLDRRTVQQARRAGVRVDQYEGVTVVLTPGGVVRTVWRNRTPRRIRS